VGGAGVADGYLDDPRLTAARFVPDPYHDDGARAYRTGDLARVRPDGALDFIGRNDRQVQVAGVRTELGEIEAVAQNCPGVRQAVAVAGTESRRGRVRLYVVAEPTADQREAARAIRGALPPHLRHLPVRFVPELPLTANGKVDRDRLSALDNGAPDPAEVFSSVLAQLSTADCLVLAHRLLESVIEEPLKG
jgi:acyl-coenzyme A synthetase/AMP-(fatty) acid ligase